MGVARTLEIHTKPSEETKTNRPSLRAVLLVPATNPDYFTYTFAPHTTPKDVSRICSFLRGGTEESEFRSHYSLVEVITH